MNLTLKQGDTRHAVSATFKNKDGDVIDLTGCSVSFSMSNGIVGTAIISDALGGKAYYTLESSATSNTGILKAEFIVTYPDGRTETFPNSEYIQILILPKVGG